MQTSPSWGIRHKILLVLCSPQTLKSQLFHLETGHKHTDFNQIRVGFVNCSCEVEMIFLTPQLCWPQRVAG